MNSLLAHMPAPHVNSAPASYASSKMAQGKMIEYVASENEGTLRAYNLHPGSIVTEMSTKSVDMTEDPKATREGVTWDDGKARRNVWRPPIADF
jgi:NAD(P)-dependent dehydrogenase (short-subunit alcohol dehydrogenase family)